MFKNNSNCVKCKRLENNNHSNNANSDDVSFEMRKYLYTINLKLEFKDSFMFIHFKRLAAAFELVAHNRVLLFGRPLALRHRASSTRAQHAEQLLIPPPPSTPTPPPPPPPRCCVSQCSRGRYTYKSSNGKRGNIK